MMKEEIKDYLDNKMYSTKKMAIALTLCGATTLALTSCGKENTTNNETQIEQQIDEQNIYILHTPNEILINDFFYNKNHCIFIKK